MILVLILFQLIVIKQEEKIRVINYRMANTKHKQTLIVAYVLSSENTYSLIHQLSLHMLMSIAAKFVRL